MEDLGGEEMNELLNQVRTGEQYNAINDKIPLGTPYKELYG